MSARLDGELGRDEAATLDHHLEHCSRCRRRGAELETLHRRVRVRAAEDVPDLTAAILAAAPSRGRAPRRVVAVAATVLAVVGAAVTLAAVTGGGMASPALAAEGAVAPEPSGSSGVVYLALSNDGGDDALVGASTTVAAHVELHRMATDDGRVLMEPTDALVCSPGLVQDAGTSHLMLRGLRRPLRPGDRFDLELVFERSGRLETVVDVVTWSDLPGRLRDA